MPQGGGDVEVGNYMHLASIINGIFKEELREFFIREWNRLYPSTPWDDTNTSGRMLHNKERSRPNAKQHLLKYKSGNTNDWDCTVLFDAILFSNAIGKSGLNVTEKNALDELRKVRNEVFHNKSNRIDNSMFNSAVSLVKAKFSELRLSTERLQEITDEYKNCRSFTVLPNDIENYEDDYDDKVNEIYASLKEDSTVFLGYPLFQFPRFLLKTIGERWYKHEQKKHFHNTFVMTLDGKNEDTLLGSFKDFADNLHCNEDDITDILESSTTNAEKIINLKAEVMSKVKNWNSWLIMVTNVVDLKKTLRFLPHLGEHGWENGRILIATSDVMAVPPDSKSITL